ncbi:MAG: segregation/condensation protein A [Clostridia bacterium]|nr:segregation/condensation protein A [Clostridia bacterium]
MTVHVQPELKIRHFEGPLDLLFHLIEKNDIDIYDIPIYEITRQYIDYIEKMKEMDMEIASDFLVMTATLIHIKSRMMLPGLKSDNESDGDDPREELVISLLRYKRCKMLAKELKSSHEEYMYCRYRTASTAKDLNIEIPEPPQEFDAEQFEEALNAVATRNEQRFADLSPKISHILKRDKISVKERMQVLWKKITSRGKIFFHELFPKDGKVEKIDRIVGFLAVLELLRGNKIIAEQKKPFDVILLEEKREKN